jgi:hypothetical protein
MMDTIRDDGYPDGYASAAASCAIESSNALGLVSEDSPATDHVA